MAVDFEKLGKVLALAGSDKEGEALAALRKADRMLKAAGMDFTGLAERLKTSAAPLADFDTGFWEDVARHAAKEPPKPKGYTVDGCTWASREEYERFCAQEEARREARRRELEPEHRAIIEKYGSEEAAYQRNAMEQAVHDAALPWLVRYAPDTTPPGRWHENMGGWNMHGYGDKKPPGRCVIEIEDALPMPRTIREAKAEADLWEARDRELGALVYDARDTQLDLPAYFRYDMVRRLYEKELPIRSLDDLHLRLQFATNADWKDDVCEAVPSILDAFERLVLNAPPEGISAAPSKLDAVQSGHPTGADPSMMSRVRHLITQLPGAEGDIDSLRGSALYILDEMRPKMIELLDHVRDQDKAVAEQMATLFGMPVDPVAGLTGDQLHAAIEEAGITKAELRKLLGKTADLKLRSAAGPFPLSLQDAEWLRPLLERLGLWRPEPVPTAGQREFPAPHQAPSAGPATATARREEVLRLLSNPDTASLSDREIARRVGVSPTTVGTLRKRAGLHHCAR